MESGGAEESTPLIDIEPVRTTSTETECDGQSNLERRANGRVRLTRQGLFSSRTLVSKNLLMQCDAHATDRECPMCTSYASNVAFWKGLALRAAFGGAVGLMCFMLTFPMEHFPVYWTADNYPRDVETIQLGAGKWEYVLILTLTGLAIGIIKHVVKFPAYPTGLFKQVTTMYVHPIEAAKVVLLSVVSISGGGAAGPSGALGSLGGGVAQVVAEYFELPNSGVQLACICGIAAAFGGLFPSPVIPVLLVIELGPTDDVLAHYMQYFMELGASVVCSFVVYYILSDGNPYLPFIPVRDFLEHDVYTFKVIHLSYAVLIGIVSGGIGAIQMGLAGVAKYGFRRLEKSLFPRYGRIISPMIGGLLIGILSIGIPLSFGSGNSQLLDVIRLADNGYLSPKLLILSAMGKMLAVSISIGSGWVGGVIFPMYFVGVCFGLSTFLLIHDSTNFPLVLSLSCFLCAVPASLFPIPLTQLVTAASMLELGAAGAAPMLVSLMTANCISAGSGLLSNMFRFAQKEHLFDTVILKN